MTNRISENFPAPQDNLVGKLLVASPFIEHHEFDQSVILVLHISDTTTFGVGLNQLADPRVVAAWQKVTGKSFDNSVMVQGGPLGGPVVAIHPFEQIAEQCLVDGVYLSTDSKLLDQLLDAPETSYRIAFGHAAWDHDQLADEIEQGFWFPLSADALEVFDSPEEIWSNSIRRYGRQSISEVTGILDFPDSPNLN